MKKVDLDVMNCLDQGYDGARNMSSEAVIYFYLHHSIRPRCLRSVFEKYWQRHVLENRCSGIGSQSYWKMPIKKFNLSCMLLSADLLENEVFLNPTQQLYKKWSFPFFFIDFDYKLPLATLRIPLSAFLRTYFLEHIQLKQNI